MSCLNPNLVYPTVSDCKNIDRDNVLLFHHYIYMDKQVCINYCGGSFVVMCQGWKPHDISRSLVRYDSFYKCCSFSTLWEAQIKFQNYVTELIAHRYDSDFFKDFT